MIAPALDIRPIKEHFELAEHRKSGYLLGEGGADVELARRLALYSKVHYYVALGDVSTAERLQHYLAHKCMRFIDRCVDELHFESVDVLRAYCAGYEAVKRYLLFTAEVFRPLYERLKLHNVYLLRRLVRYYDHRLRAYRSEVQQACVAELERARRDGLSRTALLDTAFESFGVFANDNVMDIRTCGRSCAFTLLHARGHAPVYCYRTDFTDRLKQSVSAHIERVCIEHSAKPLDDFLLAMHELYTAERERLQRYVPSLVSSLMDELSNNVDNYRDGLVFNSPQDYLASYIATGNTSMLLFALELLSKRLNMKLYRPSIVQAYAAQSLSTLIHRYIADDGLFDKIAELTANNKRTLCEYFPPADVVEGMELARQQVLHDLEPKCTKWVVDRLHASIVGFSGVQQLDRECRALEPCFAFIHNQAKLVVCYEERARQRYLADLSSLRLHVERRVMRFVESRCRGRLRFNDLPTYLYELEQGSLAAAKYRGADAALRHMVVANAETWRVGALKYDSWRTFSALVGAYDDSLRAASWLEAEMARSYGKHQQELAFVPSLCAFELEYECGDRRVDVVVNGWQWALLLVVSHCDGRVSVQQLADSLGVIPQPELRRLLASLVKGRLLSISEGEVVLSADVQLPHGQSKLSLMDTLSGVSAAELSSLDFGRSGYDRSAVAARIARLLKQHGRLNVITLTRFVNAWTPVDDGELHAHIDSLIDKEMIKRDPYDSTVFVYCG